MGKVQRSLYGLKEAARVWNKLFFKTLNKYGLTDMKTAPCLFIRKQMIIVCYVDNLILIAQQGSRNENIKRKLSNAFRLKDLGRKNVFLAWI